MFSLFVIVLISFLALFAYQIMPDNTPEADEQNPSIAMQKPGFKIQYIRLKKDENIHNKPKNTFFNGKDKAFESLPIAHFEMIDKNNIKVYIYKGDGYPSLPQIVATDKLFFKNDIQKSIIEKKYYLGTDHLGRDVLSRLILGSRVSILVGFIAVFISSILGIIIGSLAGFFRGKTDQIILWIMSVFWSIPTLLLSMALYISLKDFFSSSFYIIFIAIGFTMWVGMARMVRGQILSLREVQFVEAANSLGYSNSRIIFKHILPNITGPIIVVAASNFANAILVEAGLSFLGLGIQAPTPSWGGMLNEYKDFIGTSLSFLAILPGFMVMMLVLSFNLVGNGLRDALDIKNR